MTATRYRPRKHRAAAAARGSSRRRRRRAERARSKTKKGSLQRGSAPFSLRCHSLSLASLRLGGGRVTMRGRIMLAALAWPAMASAQTTAGAPAGPSAQGDVAVTIYQNGQALIQDVRQLELPGGRTRQEFPDVSAQIRSETVTLSGAGLGVVEQNFDYDLLSPDKLMEKAVGSVITIVRTNPATGAETREQARVLAANGGIVLQIGNRIEVLRDAGLPVRVVFD